MARPRLPADLREFLKLVNRKRVEYLLIGGYAVGYYGYPRATADLDVWVARMTTVPLCAAGLVMRPCGWPLSCRSPAAAGPPAGGGRRPGGCGPARSARAAGPRGTCTGPSGGRCKAPPS